MGNCSRHQNKVMDVESNSPSVAGKIDNTEKWKVFPLDHSSEFNGTKPKPKQTRLIRRKSSRVTPRRKMTPRMSHRMVPRIPEEQSNKPKKRTPIKDGPCSVPGSASSPRKDKASPTPRSTRSARSAKNNVLPPITHLPLYQSFVSTPRINMNFSDFLVQSIRDHNANSKEDGLYVSPNFFRKPKKRRKLEPIVVRIPTMTDVSSDTVSHSTELSEVSRTASFRTSRSRLSTVKENLSLDDLKPSIPSMCETESKTSDSVEVVKGKRYFCCF